MKTTSCKGELNGGTLKYCSKLELSRMAIFEKYCEVIFWDFDRKNNVIYNFNIISTLISHASNENTSLYYKPIVTLMMAIIECTLYDFLKRIKQERYEGINLSKSEKSAIRKTNIVDKLHRYIQICENHELLGSNKPNIYEGLFKYSKIRNRIHIQNTKRHEPIKEWELWNKSMVKSCGKMLHDLFNHLCETYPRPDDKHSNPDLRYFPTPWKNL